MVGWILIGIGVLLLAQELWLHLRNMAKARENMARRGDPSRFDAFLASRRYKLLQRSGLAMAAGLILIGILVVGRVT